MRGGSFLATSIAETSLTIEGVRIVVEKPFGRDRQSARALNETIAASFAEEDRGAAVGAWSGLTGVSTGAGFSAGAGAWRKRMGVEPTIAGISRDHWI